MPTERRSIRIPMTSRPLYPTRISATVESVLEKIQKVSESKQKAFPGRKEHPFDFDTVNLFREANPWHARCISTKTEATVGLGFRSKKVYDVLDPLCEHSFQDVLHDAIEEWWDYGGGYLEVAREGDKPTAFYHATGREIWIHVEEDEAINHHYCQESAENPQTVFARFGDLKGIGLRKPEGYDASADVGELIYLRRSSNKHRWYGYPDWLSAVPFVELVQMLVQYNFDFFLNRGVPEFLLLFLGAKVADPDWQQLEASLQAGIGYQQSHKSGVHNIPVSDLEVQLHKLALESKTEAGETSKMLDSMALAIVSSHGVPPLLAGIQIPGKLGATNELPNALRAFQLLTIGPAQKAISRILANTLGNPDKNGGLGLTREDFLGPQDPEDPNFGNGFFTITDHLDLETMDTSARMRTPEAEAEQEGRDLEEGLKE